MNVVPVENVSTNPLPVFEPDPPTPRTQKARGIAALARYHASYLVPPFEIHCASTVRPEQLLGYFSRPCPMRPRHGFVDSRKITSVEEADVLIRETLAADPEAEIVTMPLIEAACSGIWTTGLLTIGVGNDGATAGTSARTLPALGKLVTADTMAKAGVQDTPYVEILWPKSGGEFHLATRLRVNYRMAAELMLAGCHHISVWAGRHDTLLGLALGLAYRLTVTAALGEMRHAPGGDDEVSRDAVYNACWNATHLPSTRKAFESALSAFHQWVWRRSYGGAKWFDFARWAAVLNNHLVNGHARPALKAFNQLVHCAHNTGWAFDKFISGTAFTDTANNPISGLVRCAPVLYQTHRTLDARSAPLAKRFRDSRVLLSIPQGPPNLETVDDEEGNRYEERREGSSDEPTQ